jgi:hypothetical protein
MMNNRSVAKVIREIISQANDQFLSVCSDLASTTYTSAIIPAGAMVEFESDKSVTFPSMFVRNYSYGLGYVRSGLGFFTWPEIEVAMTQGVKIKVLKGVIMHTKCDPKKPSEPYEYFHDFLKRKIELRKAYKCALKTGLAPDGSPMPKSAATIFQLLIKELTNSGYGKIAQAVSIRNKREINTNESNPLRESKVSNCVVSALVTGHVRAVLAALLDAIDQHNNANKSRKPIVVASATTDGILIGIPTNGSFKASEFYDLAGELKDQSAKLMFDLLGYSDLYKRFLTYPAAEKMLKARLALADEESFLEIKAVCARVISIKTRGQAGYLEDGKCVMLARAGHRPPEETGDI